MTTRRPTVRITVPKAAADRIRELNARWIGRGMPARCKLPTAGKDWRALLKLLPGYDPFGTKQTGLAWDVHRAVQAIGFFHEYLVHIKGEWGGKPIWLERWQQAFLANLLGWTRADGTRRYRRFLLYVPRKNAKTTMAAGLQLHLLVNDGEPGAELYSAAADREQAALLFKVAQSMVARDEALSSVCDNRQYSTIHKASASAFKVISSDANTKHGFNAHGVIVDELHAQRNRELYDVLETSTGSRRNPLVGAITTADYERPSLCNEMHDHARGILEGRVDDFAFLPAVWEARRSDDFTDPKVWAKANPNLGVSVKRDYLAAAAMRAENEPAYTNTFLRLHLNVRTEQAEKWLDLGRWAGCGPKGATEQADLRAEPIGAGAVGPVCLGIDLANTEDFAAMAAVWETENPQGGANLVRCRMWFWIPEATAHAREQRGVPVYGWARENWLTMTSGERIDYARLQADILETCHAGNVTCPAFDPFNAEHMTQNLTDEGLDPVMFHQGITRMSAPTKHIDTLVATGRLRHEGCPVLAWMAGNVHLERDGLDNIRPSKKRSAEKIDGIVALAMAIGMLISGEQEADSVYEDRGLLVI
jgi:phage terminase large subunit-like protein